MARIAELLGASLSAGELALLQELFVGTGGVPDQDDDLQALIKLKLVTCIGDQQTRTCILTNLGVSALFSPKAQQSHQVTDRKNGGGTAAAA